MRKAAIISATKTIDQVGCLQHTLGLEEQVVHNGYKLHRLVIEPLSADWHSDKAPGHFRSGCAPIEALAEAKALIESGEDAVLISGEDNIKTGYPREERLERMGAVYGEDYPLTQAYTDLAQRFLEQHNIDQERFKELAAKLFENYQVSYRNALNDDFCPSLLPDHRWQQPVTELFRGVDCANPVVDFSGRLLIGSEALIEELQIPAREIIQIKAVSHTRLEGDGKDYLHQIADYQHLRDAYETCCQEANLDFAREFRQGRALLEAYTCYPVVPMAFLLASGLVDVLEELPELLDVHTITVTGGMNLARAAWNNPALNALITMHHRLLDGEERFGLIHGNGGLGYRQGVAILSR